MRLLFCFLTLLQLQLCFANISEGPRPRAGQITGGPFISSHCIITSEFLKVDLRPLAFLEDGIVTAQYDFTSDTSHTSLNLVFVARSLNGDHFKILLDGQPVSGHLVNYELPPAHWLVPRPIPENVKDHNPGNNDSFVYDSTGWGSPQQYSDFSVEYNDYIGFTIAVDSGSHRLEVVYHVQVPQSYADPVISYGFTYILSPAKDWKDYKDLNLEVYLPEDWELHSNLKLIPQADHYVGYWKDLPQDYFYVITKTPSEYINALNSGYLWTCWTILVVVIVWTLYGYSKAYRQRKIAKGAYWIVVLWLMPLGTAIFFIIFAWRDEWLQLWYGRQLHAGYSHGDSYVWIFGFIPLTLLSIGVGYILTAMFAGRDDRES